jgi:AraC-like DNA-binding protein
MLPPPLTCPPPTDAGTRLRQGLADALAGLGSGSWPLHLGPAGDLGERGAGHFHLVPELFLQLQGHTRFRFPQGGLPLAPGQALLLPPRLLHDEQVRPGDAGEPFANLVLQADGAQLGCHLAHEAKPGRPGIAHLELRSDPGAGALQGWLVAAAAPPGPSAGGPWAAAQARALVCAALAAALRLLSTPLAAGPAEPALVARLRVLVQNQLGDPALGVRSLAAQSGCTADHLSHVFRRCTGEPLVAHISRQRMARAAQLLRDTTMPGKQVAWACGYTSHSYFSAEFRRHHGSTPMAWRAASAHAA